MRINMPKTNEVRGLRFANERLIFFYLPYNLINNDYRFTPNKRAINTITAITNKRWIRPPPIPSENPPNQEITNTKIIMSINPILLTSLITYSVGCVFPAAIRINLTIPQAKIGYKITATKVDGSSTDFVSKP